MNRLQKTRYRKSVCQRFESIISKDFTNAMIITLHCSSTVAMPPELAKKVFRSWKAQAQRIAGSPFNYVRVVDYGPHPIPEVVFYVVADLSKRLCLELCGAWYMGKTSVDPLDEKGLDRLTRSLMRQKEEVINPNSRLWSYCQGTSWGGPPAGAKMLQA